ncbi:MAG: hypothetical protein JO347_03160 [Candidatus Eremiobacteraeota bacterium]|nr:hypothetical protein [Candidatus Eremiobacteraeota bacterium]MBV8281048.1 hypothetical protein [Candidatus Eremiobacteraeota bacterium]
MAVGVTEQSPRRTPPIGLLFGKAFDQAVKLTLQGWFWIGLLTAVYVALSLLGTLWGLVASYVTASIWGIVAGAAAVQTVLADFRMTPFRVFKLAGLTITIGFFTGAATLALILPGILLAVMWSLANVILLTEDVYPDEARKRSWRLVSKHFWKTLSLGFLLIAVQLAAVLFASIAVNLPLGYAIRAGWLRLTTEQVGNLGSALIFPISAYVMMAGWLVYLHWYRSLKELEPQQEQSGSAQTTPMTA